MAKILGLSFGYHDASATLVDGNIVLACSAEERFTKQKHDPNFPTYAVKYCLDKAGLGINEIDKVVFHEDPQRKFSRVLTSTLSSFPFSRKEFVNSMQSWLGQKLWTLNSISKRLGVEPGKLYFLNHHFSHATQAFLGSGFEKAGILIVDAVGEWSSTSLFVGEWINGAPQFKRLLDIHFPHSLGLVYSAFTAFLGFRPNDEECSTMALASFGKPVFVEQIKTIIQKLEDGSYQIDQSYFHFDRFYQNAFSKKFETVFGRPRSPKEKFSFSSFDSLGDQKVNPDQQRWADIACSLQRVFEEMILNLAKQLHGLVQCENLCMAGGAALNCVSNTRVMRETPFKNFFIPPDPGDGGTSLGIALYASAMEGKFAAGDFQVKTPYLAASYPNQDESEMLAMVRPARIRKYHKTGIEWLEPKGWVSSKTASPQDLAQKIADLLMSGKIVGWFRGAGEVGPRALGHRSILIRPDDISLAKRLSGEVKQRAAFRPYALSILEAQAEKILEVPSEQIRFQRWMQYAVPVRKEMQEKLRAALHVDGTTRPQVCGPEDDSGYAMLLEEFGKRFGVPALLNTSMNESGYPLCNTALDALVIFTRSNMDALVINDEIFTKVWS